MFYCISTGFSTSRLRQRTTPLHFATHPQDLLLAAGAGGSEELLVAALAVHLAPLLHESVLCQGWVAVSTVEFLGVPWLAHGHKEWAPGERKQGTKRNNSNIKKKKKKSTHTKVLIWKPCEASVKKYSGVWSTLFFSCVYDLRTGENKVLQGFFLHWYRNVDASSAAASIFYVSM